MNMSTLGEVKITEVSGQTMEEQIRGLNDGPFNDAFLELTDKNISDGFWWLAHDGLKLVGFCGFVPFVPFPNTGYYKRVGVLPEYRGQGLALKMIFAGLERAKVSTEWTTIVSDCTRDNIASANNLIRAGFKLCEPERRWGANPKGLFWVKEL